MSSPVDTQTWTQARSEYALMVEKCGKNSPEAIEKLANFRARLLEHHVLEAVAKAKALPDAKRQKIAALLLAGGAE